MDLSLSFVDHLCLQNVNYAQKQQMKFHLFWIASYNANWFFGGPWWHDAMRLPQRERWNVKRVSRY